MVAQDTWLMSQMSSKSHLNSTDNFGRNILLLKQKVLC